MSNLMNQINEVITDLQNNDADYKVILNTLIDCKEALATEQVREEPAQEPMAWEVTHMDGSAPPPYIVKHKPFYKNDSRTKVTPLYTHPAPTWQGNKEFVGLSDDEIHNLMIGKNGVYYNFARAIEQALKEKNNG